MLLNPEFHAAITQYVQAAQQVLRLGNWEVTVDEEALGSDYDDAYAVAKVDEDKWAAQIGVSRHFPGLTPEEIRYYVTHELCHLLTWRMVEAVSTFEHFAGKAVWPALSRGFHTEEERLVDMLARIMAPLLPLPEVGNAKQVPKRQSSKPRRRRVPRRRSS